MTAARPSRFRARLSAVRAIVGRSLLCAAALIALALPPVWAQSPMPSLDGTPDDLPDTAFDEGGCARGEPGPPAWALNLATLHLSVEAIDFRSRGLGPEVRLRRAYWAAQDRAGMFGSVWMSDYEARITRSSSGAVLALAGGHSVPFSGQLEDSPGTWLTTAVTLTPADTSRYRLTYEGAAPAFVLDDPRTRWLWRFEQAGTGDTFRLASIADRYGNTITLAYESRNEDARVLRIADAVGRTTFIGHDGGGRVTTITAPDNRTASFTYDAAGRLTESTDFLGARTAYTYDGTSITTITTPGNRVTRFEWTSGRVTGIVDPLQARTAYALDEAMGRVTITTPLAFVREVEHQEGRRTRETDGWWREVRTEYTGGRPTRILDGSAETKFEYDAAGNVTKRTDPSTDPAGRSTTYAWNADGLLTHRTDATGATWRYEYDSHLSLREITTPLQVRTTFLYDPRGRLLRVTDAQQRFREITWTAEGDLDTVRDRAGRVMSFTHDRYGRLLTQRLRTGGEPISFTYDALDRLVATSWAGGERRIAYDGCLVSSITDENGSTTSFAWDGRGRPMGATDAAGGSVQLTRDLDGRVTAIRDPLGRTSRTSLDRFARALELTDPANRVWRVDYDPRGRPIRLTDPQGSRASQVWNLAGELTAVEDALGFVQGYNRDALGRVEAAVTGANRRATFTYDADGRRSEVRHDTSVAHRSIYDTFGQLLERDDAGLVTTFTYDAEGRTATSNTGGLQASFAYDTGGRLGSIAYPGGLTVAYTYDARERVRTVSIGGASSTFTYDKADRLVAIARPQTATSAFQWDAAGRAMRVEHRSAAAGVFVDLAITRDLAGNVLAVTGTEPRPRLARVDVPPTTYNGAGQITTRDGVAYAYGAAGDLISVAAGTTWSAEYDPEHRLTSLTRNNQTIRFAWDADGRRIARDGRQFHYGPEGTLLFESENGQLARSYVHVDGRLFAMVEGGALRYFHFDHLGSTLALTDSAGALVGTWGYDPAGRATAGSGSPPLLFTFVGEFGVQTESGGLYLMGPRVYDTATMRFLQRHPGGLAAGPHVYEYTGGNPASLVAPDGWSGRLPTAFGAGGASPLDEAARTYARYARFAPGRDLASAALRVQDGVARQVPFLERLQRRGEPIAVPGLDLWRLWGLLR